MAQLHYKATIGEASPFNERFDQSGLDALAPDALALLDNWGSGASASLTAGSNDQRGQITVTCGDLPIDTDPRFQLTFGIPWDAAPFVIMVQENAAREPALTVSTTDIIAAQGGALSAFSTHVYDYLVIG